MASLNKVMIIGNLGADPELRYMPSGAAVANLSVATTEKWKDKESGQQQERTEWHKVSLFGRTAEVAGEYLTKGSQVYIEGSLQTRKWQDKAGIDRWTTEIKGRNLTMLGGGGGGGSNRSEPRQQAPAEPEKAPAAPEEDDIPF